MYFNYCIISVNKKQPVVPWKQMLMSPAVWAIIVADMSCSWVNYSFTTAIPTYMKEVLYFDTEKNGWTSSLPFVGFVIMSGISGVMYDATQARKLCSRTAARKIFNTIGFFIPGVLCIGVSFMDCTAPIKAVALLAASFSLTGVLFGAGYLTNPADIAPQHAGVIAAIANTFATATGVVSPTVISYITKDQLQSQWQIVYLITAAILIIGAVVFALLGSGEIQEWAREDIVKEIPTERSAVLAAVAVLRIRSTSISLP